MLDLFTSTSTNQQPQPTTWNALETFGDGDCGSVSSFNAPLRIRLARFQGTPSSTPSRRGSPSHGAHKKRPRAACELKAGTPVIPCPPIRRPPPFATTLNCRQIILRPPRDVVSFLDCAAAKIGPRKRAGSHRHTDSNAAGAARGTGGTLLTLEFGLGVTSPVVLLALLWRSAVGGGHTSRSDLLSLF